jgi:glycerophosphoryl diester phosphodiesterase
MNQFFKFTRPLIIAHRGDSLHAPENTMTAFRQAVDRGADGLELDACLTRDGVVIVLHDSTVDRTTDGNGLANRMTLNEIRRLDAGEYFGPQFHGVGIPTLEEVFAELGQRTLINVELKNYNSPWDSLPEKVVELVKKHRLQQRVLFSSFYPSNIKRIRALLPETPAALLAYGGVAGWIARSNYYRKLSPQWIHPFYKDVTRRYIEREKTLGRKVTAYTVDEPEKIRDLIHWGIGGIITSDPSRARQIMEEG